MTNFVCHRGENPNSWFGPELRLIHGLTVRSPFRGVRPSNKFNIKTVWDSIKADVKLRGQENVDMYTQTLRQAGQPAALAFSRVYNLAYTQYTTYTISIPNARTFRFAKPTKDKVVPEIGEEVDWVTDHTEVEDHYVVLNAGSLEESTVFGLGHNSNGHEVTFFTDLPSAWVTRINNQVKNVQVKSLNDLDIDTKIAVQALAK